MSIKQSNKVKLEERRKNYDFSYFAPELMTSLIAVLRRCINKKTRLQQFVCSIFLQH